jgi:hypothetical protein
MRRNLLTLVKLAVLILILVALYVAFLKSMDTKSSKFETFDKFFKDRFQFEALKREREDKELHHTGSFFNGQPKNIHKKKIDWHDYEFIKCEGKRAGLGEQGKPASLSKEEAEAEDKLFKRNGFNALLSDKISLNRSVPDIRHPGYVLERRLY